MDSWERFDGTMLPNKKDFYTDEDYIYVQKVF